MTKYDYSHKIITYLKSKEETEKSRGRWIDKNVHASTRRYFNVKLDSIADNELIKADNVELIVVDDLIRFQKSS